MNDSFSSTARAPRTFLAFAIFPNTHAQTWSHSRGRKIRMRTRTVHPLVYRARPFQALILRAGG